MLCFHSCPSWHYIRSLCWYSKISHPLGTFQLSWCVPSTTILSHFNQWLTCLLYLRNGLLSVMMQQSCNNALPLVGEELPNMRFSQTTFAKFHKMSPPQQNYHFLDCRVFFLWANMCHRITTEIDLVPYDNISHIQSILSFTTKSIRSSTIKMSPLQQNVLISQKNQEILW